MEELVTQISPEVFTAAESFYPWTGGVIGLGAAVGWFIDRPKILRLVIGGGLSAAWAVKTGLDVTDFVVNGNFDTVSLVGNLGGAAIILVSMLERMRRHRNTTNNK